MKKLIKKILSIAAAIVVATGIMCTSSATDAYAFGGESRPSNSGYLQINKDGMLVSQDGELVQLRGVSTHGLLYYPNFVDEDLFRRISSEWGVNLVRLAVYSEDYCNGNERQSLELLFKGIDAAIDNNMYVIVDWHILNDNDPNENVAKAVEFFSEVGKKYGKIPNIIYEICNEPNGDTTWGDIKNYANCIIPVIKNFSDEAIIIVGTPNFDREIRCAVEDPIKNYDNIMYAYHFYASSHGSDMRNDVRDAIGAKLPVFISESGISPESGDGQLDYDGISSWYNMVNNLNISYTIWSLSNKDETSAMFVPSLTRPSRFTDDDLTDSGKFAKAYISGENASNIAKDLRQSHKYGALDRFVGKLQNKWIFVAAIGGLLTIILFLAMAGMGRLGGKKYNTYPKLLKLTSKPGELKQKSVRNFGKVMLILTSFFSLVYLTWRVIFSVPLYAGVLAIICNIILLIVEIMGFVESQIHYSSMISFKEYPVPEVEGEFPDVDIFVATYNEPTDLLRKTLYGCKMMDYPDKNKVHIYLCDDKRRPSMRELAEELGVNYFDRPDNKGAKAGNLNAALARTSSPYVVTFDADMIPQKQFLMKTIPYFMDAERRNAMLPEGKKTPMGFIQTPQCFYSPDVFQYNLYNENRIPNEQDFFYRTIEAAKTEQNCVIYGGSNTLLSREALNAIGGFYTETITEDFATGMLIEAAGFVSLGLPTPLASGLSASSYKEHIQQRTRWGRGVISTARQLKYGKNKNLSALQKLNYFGSVFYWYSPIKNLIYILAPMMYAVFTIPMFVCTTEELALFWLPMLICQTIYMPMISRGSLSYTWSGIQEISVMPKLLLPIIQESLGITLSSFKVTNKDKRVAVKEDNTKDKIPFFILIAVSVFGIIRVIIQMKEIHAWGLIAVLFWLIRNLYFCLMSLFLIDGRVSNLENAIVKDAEVVSVTDVNGQTFDGITTVLTEHNLSVYLDTPEALKLGQVVRIDLINDEGEMELEGTIVALTRSKNDQGDVYTIEILDFKEKQDIYTYNLYNRVPSLPQNLKRNLDPFTNFWMNYVRHISDKG